MAATRIYTDGACRGNGAPDALSGCGVWFGPEDPRNVSTLLPHPPHTNQRAELYAAIVAMRAALAQDPPPAVVEIVSDSAYCVKGITTWMHAWEKKGWCKYDGKPVMNLDLWRAASADARALRDKGINLYLIWVKGHAGDIGNSAADDLAGRAVRAAADIIAATDAECADTRPTGGPPTDTQSTDVLKPTDAQTTNVEPTDIQSADMQRP